MKIKLLLLISLLSAYSSSLNALTYADYELFRQAYQAGNLPEVLDTYQNNKLITPGEKRKLNLSYQNNPDFRKVPKDHWVY